MSEESDPASGSETVGAYASGYYNFTKPIAALWVPEDGQVCIKMPDGTEPIFYGVKAGSLLPFNAIALKQTGTTVANPTRIVGLVNVRTS